MSRRPSDPRAGFTLLEVVLAMTSLVMVTAICYAAFHLGMRAVERGEVAVVTCAAPAGGERRPHPAGEVRRAVPGPDRGRRRLPVLLGDADAR